MAEKNSTLSITIRTIDRATAGIRAINDRISKIGGGITRLGAPIALIGSKLKGLADAAGFPKLIAGFQGVGSAAKGLGVKFLGLGALSVGAVLGLKSISDKLLAVDDIAIRLGVSFDFVAQMRNVAERTGASVDDMTNGLQQFTEGLGQARANTGRLNAFLTKVSPTLLKQLKATKNTEEAFLLLSDAMVKIQDPAKRAALAQKTVGTALVTALNKGSKGINELRQAYARLAGSQQKAAELTAGVDDSLKDLTAASDGVKAAILEGLAPALKVIVAELAVWFADNREQIREWAAAIGAKLPGAIAEFASAAKGAIGVIADIISNLGGAKFVVIALAASIAGPMITAIISLGAAILTTPLGWLLAGIAALAASVILVIRNWDKIKAFFSRLWSTVVDAFSWAWDKINGFFLSIDPIAMLIRNWGGIKAWFGELWDGVVQVFTSAWAKVQAIVDKVIGAAKAVKNAVTSVGKFISGGDGVVKESAQRKALVASGILPSSNSKISIVLANAPPGTRVIQDHRNAGAVDLSVGYQRFQP